MSNKLYDQSCEIQLTKSVMYVTSVKHRNKRDKHSEGCE